MAVGIVSYLSKRGLGTMCHDLRTHLGIDRQLVIPDGNWPYTLEWCNGEEFYLRQWEVERDDLIAWKQVDKIDTLVSIETGFGDNTFKWAKEIGMKTILICMWEHYHPRLPAYRNVDLVICPSWKAFQEVPYDSKVFLPYPVDTEEFTFAERSGPAKVFVHNAGSGGLNGRKGTLEALKGFQRAAAIMQNNDLVLLLRSQVPILDLITQEELAAGDYGQIEILPPTKEKAEQYEDGDVLIAPAKYEGHFLVGLEAMASGMPVITTDAAPMNELFQKDRRLLVNVETKSPAGTVNPHCMSNIVSIEDLAQKIIWCATNDMQEISRRNRQVAEEEHSWKAKGEAWKKRICPPVQE